MYNLVYPCDAVTPKDIDTIFTEANLFFPCHCLDDILRENKLYAISTRLIYVYLIMLTYSVFVTISFCQTILYVKIDPLGGLLYFPFSYMMYRSAVKITINSNIEVTRKKNDDVTVEKGMGRALKIACIVNFIGWYLQIHPGHIIFEGNSPALVDSLGGALSTAPLFAFYEGIWVIGINTQLKESVMKASLDHARDLCETKNVYLCKFL
mmetsp:Transcript_5668/g.8220  ORF Transcript_5668/g.8220 Transcript_5668/m.8220 type:complete len:209 (+) Transcript_5668:139-765(+)